MRALVAYAVALTCAVVVLGFALFALNDRVLALEQRVAREPQSTTAIGGQSTVAPSDVARAEEGYQHSRQFAADIAYSLCRREGGSIESCAKRKSQ